MIINICFDLDDTLVECNRHYIDKIHKFAEATFVRTEINKEISVELVKNIDKASSAIEDGHYHKYRFPRSFSAASAMCDIIQGNPIDEIAMRHAYAMGDSVYDDHCAILSGAYDLLDWCKSQNMNLFMWTKGDIEIQAKKIAANNLSLYFPSSHIHIVTKKTSTTLENMLNIHQLDKSKTIMIGDSLKDDIKSAHHANVKSIWMDVNSGRSDHTANVYLYDWRAVELSEVKLIIEAANK